MARGGARPGAGRKRKIEKYESPIVAAENRLADRLPLTIDNLEKLADGGQESYQETWEPAGTILIDDVEIEHDAKGNPRPIKVKRLAFPDLPADELVLVRKVVSVAAPDRTTNIYLSDRVMGKPTERVEHDGDIGVALTNDLSRLGDEELDQLETLVEKATDSGGDKGRKKPPAPG